MNRIYRSIWNEASRTFVAVAEKVRAKGKPASTQRDQVIEEALVTSAGAAAPQAAPRPRVRPRALEQRFMFDAAAVSTAVDAAGEAVHHDVQADSGLSSALDKIAQSVAQPRDTERAAEPVLVRTADQAASGGRKEVVFVDSRVANYQTLVDGIGAGIEVRLIDGSQDGLAQLAAWAASHSGYDAIHILSHGNEGQLSLGAGTIDLAALQARSTELAALGRALTVDGDILLYGCDVASSQQGAVFISELASLTGADIAASSDATGAASLGGDWNLEVHSGQLETAAIDATGYGGLLATPVNGDTTFNSITDPYVEYARSTSAYSTPLTATNIAGSGWDVTGTSSADGESFLIASEIWPGSRKIIYFAYESGSDAITSLAFRSNDGKMFDLNTIAMAFNSTGSASEAINFTITGYLGNTVKGTYVASGLLNNASFLTFSSLGFVGVDKFVITPNTAGILSALDIDTINATNFRNAVSAPVVTLSVNNSSISETGGSSTITATLDKVASTDTVVTLTPTGTASGSDYSLSSTTITILAGQTTGSATLTATGDTLDEADETVVLDITSVSGGDSATESGSQQVTVTILDDDAAPGISIADASVTEGNSGTSTLSFTVSLSAASGKTVSVNYASSNGTATAGVDYTAASGTLTFAPGETSKTITLNVTGDTTQESNETVNVTLTSPSNGTLTDASAVGTILDDENANPTISDVANQTINEGGATSALAVTIGDSETAANSLTLAGSSSNTTLIPNGNIVISGSGANRTVTITPAANQTGSATITLTVDDGNGGTATDTFTVTVSDVDPVLSNATASIDENAGSGTAVTTVTASGDTNGLVYSITGGTGSSLFDINSTTGAITVKNGAVLDYETASQYTLTVAVDDEDADTTADSTATITINLNDLNEAPTDISLSASSLGLSQSSANTTVATLSATDQDSGSSHTYSLVAGSGDTHNGSFVINGNTLKVGSSALAAGTYLLRVQATDNGSLTYQKALTVTVSDDVAPTLDAANSTPANNALQIAPSANIVLLFSETLQAGTGTLELRNVTTGQVVETFNIATGTGNAGGTVSISGNSVTLNPGSNLAEASRYSVRVDATALRDAAANAFAGISDDSSFNFTTGVSDSAAPLIQSIQRQTPAGEASNATSLVYTVRFNEAVTAADVNDFVLASTGTASGTISSVSGSGTDTLTVTVSGVSGTGTLGLNLGNSQNITDIAGNALATAEPADDEVYAVDRDVPTLVSINRVGGEQSQGGSVQFLVVFSEPVGSVDAADFALLLGGTASGTISSISGSGTPVLTVTVSNASGSGSLGLQLANGYSISDASGNALASSSPDTGVSEYYTVDSVAPTVTSITRTADSLTTADSVSFDVSFSEGVNNVGLDDFSLTTSGSVAGTISAISGSNGHYRVTVSGISGSGTLGLAFAGGQDVADDSGNALTATTSTLDETYTIDNTAPAVSAINRAGVNQIVAGASTDAVFTVVFSEVVSGVSAADFTVTGTAANTGISSVSSSDGKTFHITVSGVNGSSGQTVGLNFSGTVSDRVGQSGSTAFSAGQVYTVGNLLLNEGAIDQAALDGLLGVNRDGVQKLVSSSTAVTQVVIIDSRLPGLAQQLNNLAAGTEVWLLDGTSSAMAQISQILAQYHNLAAVHLLSHGSEGALYLGAETLSAANLAAQQTALAAWGSALSASGDFLLYGCDVAKGTTGTDFIAAFAAATQADVAASNDLTGASWLGGDWVLEQSVGQVDIHAIAADAYGLALGAMTTMDMANGTLDAGAIYVRPNGTSNEWVFGNGWFRMNGFPDESLPIVSVALGTDFAIPAGSSVQYSTDGGGSWTNLTSSYTSVSGKVWRYVDGTGNTSNYDFTLNYTVNSSAYAAGVQYIGSWLNIKADQAPTEIVPTYNAATYTAGSNPKIFTDLAQGVTLATLTPTDTGNTRLGYWVLESQSVANLFTLTSNTSVNSLATLALGTGNIPAAGQSATVTLRYYDLLQTDGANVPLSNSGISKTITFDFVAESTRDLADLGDDFAINTTTDNAQSSVSTAKLSNGNYVATWLSTEQSDPGHNSVVAQILSPTGSKIGNEIIVSSANNGQDEYYPVVTALSNGRFVVAYLTTSDNDGDYGIAFVIVNADGTTGSETIVNSTTDRYEEFLSVANIGNDQFVVIWSSATLAYDGSEVYSRTYDSSGNAVSAEVTIRAAADINGGAGGFVAMPTISSSGNGTYAVGWLEYDSSYNLLGAYGRIGNGTPFLITSQPGIFSIRLATLADGSVVAAWSDQASGTDDVYFQRYDSTGVAQGSVTQANTVTSGSQAAPSIAALAGGGFVIGWESSVGDYSSSGVFGRRFDAQGVAIDASDFEINQHRRNGQTGVSITAGDGNSFFSAWSDDTADGISNGGIEGRIYTATVAAPVVTLSVSNSSISETGGSTTITATLDKVASTDTVVTLTPTGTASGSDYSLSSTTITILAGQTTGSATLTATGDTLDEADETVVLDITSVSGGDSATESGSQQVTVTILDDDAAPGISIADASVTEGNSGTSTLSFTVSLSAASGKTVSVNYASSNGTATAGVDYTAASGTLTFAPGETSKTITLNVTGDTTQESNETVNVTLTSPSNGTLTDASAVGTILDDENANPTISDVANQTINEGGATSALAVTIGDSETAANSLTLAGSSSNTTLIPNGNIVISGSGANRTVTITPAANQTGSATITLTVDDGNGGTATDTFTVTVSDVDPVLSNATASIDENAGSGTAVTTVTASGDTNGLVYSITGGTGSSLFDINSTTGAITVKNGAVLDYETASQYTLTVAVDDEDADTTADSTATITINLNDLNEAPTDIALATLMFANTQAGAGVTLTTISGTDPDTSAPNNTLSYSLASGSGDTDNASFVVDGTSLKVASGSGLAAGSYSLRLRVSDGGSLSYEKAFSITVIDPVPMLVVANPLDNSTGVAVSSHVVLNFSEAITLGSGNIVLYDITGNGANSITIDVANHGGQLSINSSVLTINPSADLRAANQYAVQIASTALRDSSSQAYAGIADITSLNFTTGTTDTLAPIATIIDLADPSSTNAGTASIRFSEQVQNVDISDFTLTRDGHTVDISSLSVSGSGASYTLDLSTVTTVAGTYVLTLNTSNITDTSGNALAAAVSDTFVIDKTVPTAAAIVRASATPTNSGSLNFTVVFTEAVSGVDSSDFTLSGTASSGASIASLTRVSDSVYTVAVTGASGNGTLGLNLKSSGTGIADLAGNAISGGATGQLYTLDNTAPSVVGISRTGAQYTTGGSVSFTVTFDGDVSGVSAGDFTLSKGNGVVASDNDITVTGSGSSYTVTVANVSGNGLLGLQLKSSGTGISDRAGNAISTGFSSGAEYVVDQTNPVVTASQTFTLPENMASGFVIGQVLASDANSIAGYQITAGDSAGYFSIDADGVITLTAAGAADGAASRDYEATPNSFSLTVLATDVAGNSHSQVVTISLLDAQEDSTPPTATITLSDTALRIGETATVTITFSEAVTGFSNTDLTIANGTLSAVSSSDGGITWTATFTPSANISDASNVITLDNSGVVDLFGNAGSGSTDSNNYAIDTTRPTASIVVADTALAIGETSLVTITFSEAVTGFTNADLTVANGTLSAVSSSDGGITWTATLTPSANVSDSSNLITLDNTGISDAAGNAGSGA
ncbi:DUF4347 domain-containing protein, partial [Vogesella sp. DC21W]